MALTTKTKLSLIGVIVAVLVIGLVIWNQKRSTTTDEIVIGISPPFAKPLQVAVDEAKKDGINVRLVEFSDWNTPNITLNHGDIDANYFQHQPFLSNAIKEAAYKIKPIAHGIATHVGLYSKKYKSLQDVPNGAQVVIPNDPVNQGRALLLLQQVKLISLKDPNNHLSNLQDISSNPKNFKFVEVEGPQTARAVDEADLVFSYPHYLRLAGTLDPNDALAFDDTTSNRYAILFVVRDDYETQHPEKAEQLKKFIHIYQNSAQVKHAINAEVGEKLWFAGWK
ncbi:MULTISPECIES: MetQ/NlpA family ABC transporter substrate-binding protein [Acinetobacter]|uniref:Methionine transporter n=1 Tax=Acinetobacter chengduensis TaxID=2420890 RepID=A0ABX9TUQ1_9GAMM|nr:MULTISPECIES: MetQ/NlpA family ABC transporter substrate-binding protein [Acinetobacter]MBI1453284.1 methionine transporter [Acinetobacter sp. FL51]RKG41408.1 methionine transporter [Acinetobacter sp. WCHAc060007]RLL20418.1 methionine transporter [Acinetobacter chengduensis]